MRLVIDRAIPSITSIELLLILKEIPETIPLSEYEDLIPDLEEKLSKREEPDWTDQYLTSTDEPQATLDRSMFVQWLNNRIISFESFGLIDNALQLSEHAKHFEEFVSLSKLLHLENLLNRIAEQDLTLKQMKDMTEEDFLEIILTFKSDANQEDIDKRIERILCPALELIDQSTELLKKNLVDKLQKNIDIYPIIRSLKVKMNEFDQLIQDLILNVNSIDQIPIASQLLTLMKDKQDFEYIIE